ISLETVGLGVMRTGWEKTDMWALLDSAHYGWGHQHEDKLSFDLYAYGKRMLEDGGQYEYDSSEMRSMITSSRAHNTALVDYAGQNRATSYSRVNEERYVRDKIPSDLFWNYDGEEYEAFEGSYKYGYGSCGAIKVDHHRKVIFFKKGLEGTLPFFVMIDRFDPKDDNEHIYEVLFQLGTEPIDVDGKKITVDHGDGVSMSLVSSVAPNIIIGQYKPRYMGWRKNRSEPGKNIEHFKAPAILFTDKAKKDHIVTVIYPNNQPDMPISAVSASDAYEGKRTFTLTLTNGKEYTFDEDDALFATFDRDGNRCAE
ncbi:MAG: heparinase II/III family protein, partial [Firmicutes bacterium]|nr:heparinase II/III family protein [Candidatus Colimorpha enterica]